jgi:nitrogen-specific signal transduction histidine kinase
LAYRGLRAKDKSLNATLKTHYDESLKPIRVVPQDIGRAILNLITNAFYAVAEKKKMQVKMMIYCYNNNPIHSTPSSGSGA